MRESGQVAYLHFKAARNRWVGQEPMFHLSKLYASSGCQKEVGKTLPCPCPLRPPAQHYAIQEWPSSQSSLQFPQQWQGCQFQHKTKFNDFNLSRQWGRQNHAQAVCKRFQQISNHQSVLFSWGQTAAAVPPAAVPVLTYDVSRTLQTSVSSQHMHYQYQYPSSGLPCNHERIWPSQWVQSTYAVNLDFTYRILLAFSADCHLENIRICTMLYVFFSVPKNRDLEDLAAKHAENLEASLEHSCCGGFDTV